MPLGQIVWELATFRFRVTPTPRCPSLVIRGETFAPPVTSSTSWALPAPGISALMQMVPDPLPAQLPRPWV